MSIPNVDELGLEIDPLKSSVKITQQSENGQSSVFEYEDYSAVMEMGGFPVLQPMDLLNVSYKPSGDLQVALRVRSGEEPGEVPSGLQASCERFLEAYVEELEEQQRSERGFFGNLWGRLTGN